MALLKRRIPGGPGRRVVLAGVAAAVLAAPATAGAQSFLTQDEALALAFPSADTVVRRTAFLDEAQLARVRALAGRGVEVPSGVVTYYVAVSDGRPTGAAYFDAHRVRTLPEVLMIVVGPGDRVGRIEVVKFAEPPEYVPPDGWLAQFDGEGLRPGLAVGDGVIGMTGATLTSRAVTGAVRRTLALHRVIAPLEGGDP